MGLRKPESMQEIIYFTQRTIGDGEVMAWVFRQKCPECGKAEMGKPRNKSGKVAIRASEYVCPECNHTIEKSEYEDSLTVSLEYTCPQCKNEGELEVPYKRKNIEGVKTIRFQCQKCNANIDITKKMKEKKAKK